jgi:hypothetical protein
MSSFLAQSEIISAIFFGNRKFHSNRATRVIINNNEELLRRDVIAGAKIWRHSRHTFDLCRNLRA